MLEFQRNDQLTVAINRAPALDISALLRRWRVGRQPRDYRMRLRQLLHMMVSRAHLPGSIGSHEAPELFVHSVALPSPDKPTLRMVEACKFQVLIREPSSSDMEKSRVLH